MRSEITYEEIVQRILTWLGTFGVLPSPAQPVAWDSFVDLSQLVHRRFRVPGTSFTPVMRRLLFGLSATVGPRGVFGVGTYVGYTFSWLLRNRADAASGPPPQWAVGCDIDPAATAIARTNCTCLNHGRRLRFVEQDGVAALRSWSDGIDLLYIDIDHPTSGKSGYKDVLEAAMPLLQSGAVVLAHDPCVERFADDFRNYHDFVASVSGIAGPWVLPIDACGITVAQVPRR